MIGSYCSKWIVQPKTRTSRNTCWYLCFVTIIVMLLFLAVLLVGLQCAMMVLSDHTRLLFVFITVC